MTSTAYSQRTAAASALKFMALEELFVFALAERSAGSVISTMLGEGTICTDGSGSLIATTGQRVPPVRDFRYPPISQPSDVPHSRDPHIRWSRQ
jgi:hypothetical protein